jgi:hypothetical protein
VDRRKQWTAGSNGSELANQRLYMTYVTQKSEQFRSSKSVTRLKDMKGSFHNVATVCVTRTASLLHNYRLVRPKEGQNPIESACTKKHSSYLCTTSPHLPTARKQKHEENQEISSSKIPLIQKRSAATVELKLLSNAPVLLSDQNSISLFMRLLSGG